MPAFGGQLGDTMEDARKMGKSELFSHFAERFDMKRTQSREFFDELAALCEKELKRTGEFVIPGMVKLVLKKTNARTGRNPATGQPIPIAAKTVVKARIVKQLKDAVLPKKPRLKNSNRTNTGRLVSASCYFLIFLASSRISSRSILNFNVLSGTPR